jgi:outer membrane protein OmpA-like peptidoglycan-associated protein
VLEEDFIRLRTPGETLQVRARRLPLSAAPADVASGHRAAQVFRFGLENGDAQLVGAAQVLLHLLDGHAPSVQRPLAFSEQSATFVAELVRRVESEFARGRLVAEFVTEAEIRTRDEEPEIELPPLPPKKESGDTFFDVKFVDEIGQGINRIAVLFDLGDETREVTTNAAGVALLEGVTESSAKVAIVDLLEAESVLDPRWQRRRPGTLAKESNSVTVAFDGRDIAGIGVRAAIPQRVVIEPPLGRIFVELYDKTGRVPHAEVPYVIDGPERFEGRTDESGRLAHERVFPGDYQLSFEHTIELPAPEVETLATQVLVLAPNSATPEVRLLGVKPRVELSRIRGLLFDTNKSFLLPASTAIFERFRDVFLEHRTDKLLIVGHTDTTAEANINDPLSLERAENTAAYLRDDVDAWLAMYEPSVRQVGRWGDDEDTAMLLSMPDFDTKAEAEDDIRWFQRTRGLEVDGIAGPITRRQLITEYMALDGMSLASDEFQIEVTTHGCGENFPLDDGQNELDANPRDDQKDAADRRVELFFFDPEFGIVPPPPGKNSKAGSSQYPTWRKRAKTLSDDELGDFSVQVRLFDNQGEALPNVNFRFDAGSAVISGTSDAEAFVQIRLRVRADSGTLSYLDATPSDDQFEVDTESSPFVFSRLVFLELLSNAQSQADRQESTRRALHNLGYDHPDLVVNVRAFQFDNELDLTGNFEDVRSEALRRNEQGEPERPG